MMFGPGLGVAPKRPPPAVGKMAPFINLYNDPFRWSITKSAIGFVAGVLFARQIASEVATM